MTGTENGKDATDDRFRILHLLFKFGATPLIPVGSHFYNVFSVFLMMCSYVTPPMMIMGALQNLDDIPYVMEVARPLITISSIMWMNTFIRYKMQGVRDLLNIVRTFDWTETPGSGRRTIAGLISRAQRLAQRIYKIFVFNHSMYLLLRLATNSKSTHFFNTWIPFDSNSIVVYFLILIIQGLASWVYILMLVSPLTLYASLVAVCCTQLEKIQTELLNMRKGEEESPWAMKSRLAECVKHHQKVMRFMVTLEDTFYLVLLGPFLSIAAGLCFTAYTLITVSGNYGEIIQMGLVVFAMLAKLLIFCWLGNELTEQAEKVGQAAWESDWVGTDSSHQRSLHIVMTASKDFILTAGKIIPVSRRTMLLVLNEAYTYFMFLLNFVSDSSEGK